MGSSHPGSKSNQKKKGRLRTIWVAAYCLKKLNKAQVAETDISASVDKILKDDWDAIAYRVLAYLLGVVRIYSKKVEYLFDDCHDMVTEINKFVGDTKEKEDTDTLRAPYESITLPERFELDAFDLGILEDVSGGNDVSYEAITLNDCSKGNARKLPSDMYAYEEFGSCHGIFSANYVPDKHVLPFDGMELDMERRASSNMTNPDVSMENPQDSSFQVKTSGDQIKVADMCFPEDVTEGEAMPEKRPDSMSEEKSLKHETFCGIEEELLHEFEPLHEVEPCVHDQETNVEQIKAAALLPEVDEIQEQASLVPSCHITSSAEDHQINRGELNIQSENDACPLTIEDGVRNNFETDRGNLKSCTFSQEKLDLGKACNFKKSQQPAVSPGEGNHADGNSEKLQDMALQDNMKCQITAEKDSEALGTSTPRLRRVIRTPTIRKAGLISRKRKRRCLIDELTVLPNAYLMNSICIHQGMTNHTYKCYRVIKQSINDASDLVSKRSKVPETALAAWKAYQIRNLSQMFLEPFVSSVSEVIRSLFHRSVMDFTETGESRVVGKSEQVETAQEPPVHDYLEIVPGTPIRDKTEIAPGTPVLRSTSTESLSSPKSPEASAMDIAEPSRWIEEEPFMEYEPAYPSESLELPSVDRDQEHDFNLLNEEPNLCDQVNPELDGWSNRTRVVARYLHKQFIDCKNQGVEEVKLSRISKGKTKKESARLFYETLVLKTNGYVDMKQDEAFGDILLRKVEKWDQTCNRDSFQPMYSSA